MNEDQPTPDKEFDKELGIIARVDPPLLHHMDHGKSHPIIVIGLGESGINHEALIEHTKKSSQKIGIVGHIPLSMQGKTIIVDDGFHKKLNEDFKKEINLLNDHFPISQEGNNRAARRKKNKFKNKKR